MTHLSTLFCLFSTLVIDSDYTTGSPLEVTFVSGSALVNSASCAQISIIDDEDFEGPHSFCVEVSMVEVETDGTDPLLTIGTLSSAAIYIEDNDSKSFLVFPLNVFSMKIGNSSIYKGCKDRFCFRHLFYLCKRSLIDSLSNYFMRCYFCRVEISTVFMIEFVVVLFAP